MERSSSMLCWSPMSMSICWNSPVCDVFLSGMRSPFCSIYCSSATVLRQTDFPPALGPDMSRMCCCRVSVMSSGTMFFCSCRSRSSNSGW